MLQPIVLVSLLGMGLALETLVTIVYQYEHLIVMVEGAPENSTLRILRLDPRASICANSHGAVVVLKGYHISDDSEREMSFPTDEFPPGEYCAEVVSSSGNFMSEWPAEIKEESGADGISQPNCYSWNATVIVVGSYTLGTINATVSVFQNSTPGCQELRVALWQVRKGAKSTIVLASQKTEAMPNSSFAVLFENVTTGHHYCVRVTPVCDPYEECLTLESKVIELPSAPVERASRGWETNQSRVLWMLLLPLLVGAAAAIGLAVLWARPQMWGQPNRLLRSPLPSMNNLRNNPGPPVVKVVYSRDSDEHIVVVSQLCSLLQSKLGMRVQWDEAAMDAAHVTHDWAMAMAQLPCPLFNPAAVQAPGIKAPEMILVLESDGALLKHLAYRQHKDLGAVSESDIDELYHTTYAALLSNQAQALGDYCHIVVARLPYTTLPIRLDLVPEKRYLLPDHLHQLLAKLLYATFLPESCADAALSSDACRRFQDALAIACNAHNTRGFAAKSLCGKLQAMLRES